MPYSKTQSQFQPKAVIQRYTSARRATYTESRFTSRASRGQLQKFWRVRIMDPFKTVSKISISTIIFGVLVLFLGWLITATSNPIFQLQLGEAALVLLSLFFYSLTSDKVDELEEMMKIIAASRRSPKAKLVP